MALPLNSADLMMQERSLTPTNSGVVTGGKPLETQWQKQRPVTEGFVFNLENL